MARLPAVLLLSLFALLLYSAPGTAQAPKHEIPAEPWIPQIAQADLDQVLELAGANRGELQRALDYGIQKPFTMDALRFLVANLPLSDLGVITADELIEHVDLAMAAWFDAPYGWQVDPATWAHYVLAPRVSQEPLSRWRPYFHAELKDLVADCTTLEQAAVKVNYWCGAHVRFQQTQRRDQGPLVTLKSGYGRCEEEMIVLVCALRSVGIPARNAYCPYWSWMDNNHAWTEIYGSDGRWHYAGSCEPAESLDQAWFTGATKQAPLILSMCYGLPDELGYDVLSHGDQPGARYCVINSTANYRETGVIGFRLPVAADAAKPKRVFVSIFNFGALRTIAKVELDAEGAGQIELGPGLYLLSTDADVAQREVLARVPFGKCVAVDWAKADPPGASYVLDFPADPPAEPAP